MDARKRKGKRLAMMMLVLALSMIYAAIPAAASGSIYYVSTTGNDSNPGSSVSPFLTVAHAVSVVGPGDTIIVKSGTYHESVNLGSLSGTATDYITIKSEVPGGAYIDTTSLGSGYNLEPFLGAPSYIEINGFELSSGANSAGIHLDGGHHTKVYNNIIHNTGASGIQLDHGDYRFIENNIVYNTAYYMYFAGSGISLWQAHASDSNSGYHNIIRNNISYSNNNLSGTAETDGNGIIFDDSRNTQNGSTLGAYTGSTLIEDNLTYDNGGRGIEVYLSDNVTVRNNTAYKNSTRNDSSTWRGEFYVVNSSNVTVANNVAVTDSSTHSDNRAILIGRYGGDAMTNVIWRNNLTYDTYDPGDPSYKRDTASTEVPTTAHGNILGEDPLFVDAANADFRLTSCSPAINAGTSSYGSSSDDLDGNSRTIGSAVDMGAYEFQSEVTGSCTGGGNTYNENFNDDLAQGWTLDDGGAVSNSLLNVQYWYGDYSLNTYGGMSFSSYSYQVNVRPYAQSVWNKAQVYFNYQDSNNYDFVEMDGGAPNGMYLKKMVGGTESTIATYSGGYSTYNQWTTLHIASDSDGSITVTATQSGNETTLFTATDTTFTSGKIGVGGWNVGADFDNIVVQYEDGEELPLPPDPTPSSTPLPGEQTIFTNQVPAGEYNDTTSYELGTLFQANFDGKITKVRIYTGASEGGIHQVRIWNAEGTLLAGPYSWNIASGTAGWKEYDIPDLAIGADTDYIVAVSTSSDYYYSSMSGTFNSPIINGNLITYIGSGLFGTTPGDMPSSSYHNSGYFRDIVFEADIPEE
ncbi:DUF4082 domain-containing protein [Cohnella zeiphila]|uniref:DUF4082 domain-containing protein n=1 Tax=Cohnella zeiphila TaxID=2761120 RepID=A0A7X0SSD9_9BACL|nr:DUF4082 domain-containing protein [Cohnella zeiphila]MBB6734025.1 DUF4082 domain-containing protein [Cohnella zeiphila]